MKKNYKSLAVIFIVLLFIGCGGGGGGGGVIDTDMQDIDGLNPPKFASYTLPGTWIQYEYDVNDEPKVNALGMDFKYAFTYDKNISMNISIIDTWIPLGKFTLNAAETELTFHEGNVTTSKIFKFVEFRDGACLKVSKTTTNETNTTLDGYYHLCKQS